MPLKFNPFSGTFDQTGSGGTSSSGPIDGEVPTYNDLSLDVSVAPLNSSWLVRTASGSWFTGGSKPAGIYVRTGIGGSFRDADFTYAGLLPSAFADYDFKLYNSATPTKALQFDLSGVSASTTRTLTIPNASGTIALEGTSPSFDCNRSGISNQTGGTINWNLQYDTTGGFSGGNKFTVPAGKQGLWAFNAAVYFQGDEEGNEYDQTSDVTVELAIKLNATRSKAFYAPSFDKVSGQGQAQVFGIFNLSSGDEITIAAEFFYNGGTVRSDSGVNWFTGVKL